MKILHHLRGLFLYCGVTKEEYRAVKKEAYISNYKVWKVLHFLIFAGYALLMLGMSAFDGFTPVSIVQIVMIVYFALMSILFLLVFKKDSLIAQFGIYLSMILLLLATIFISYFSHEKISVTFTVLLVMLPMFMIDRPYFMAILLGCAIGAYVHVSTLDPSVGFSRDMMLTMFYGIFGVIVNVFYNTIRIREFVLTRRERDLIEEQKNANAEAAKLNSVLKKMSESALELLGDIVEERDAESGEHIHRVKGFTYILANQVMSDLPEYGLDTYTVDLITFTSALHDVGKISITDAVLRKPGKLTNDEFDVMKTHCELGCEILEKMRGKWSDDYLEMGMTICMNHHEKWDGRGYPRGLKGEEIPIAAQIVSIADIYDALTSKRVYKDAYSDEEARRMILSGECGAFSEKLLGCFVKCWDKFKEHAASHSELPMLGREYELVSVSNPAESFVIGLHDSDRTLREKLRLDEELSVMVSLSETFCYVCYVNMKSNEVVRFKADEQFTRILDSYAGLCSYERFDKLLNSIIVSEDYADFRAATEREKAVAQIKTQGHLTTDFRIRLEDGVHYCRMRISYDTMHPDAVIVGISKRDEEHQLETEYLQMQNELENARREMENREKLADRLAVIDSISDDYDYVCSLNVDTMAVVVYRAVDWIRDMFKNLEDLVVSPEVRNETLKGIIHADDFEQFLEGSKHPNVMAALRKSGVYCVDYRAYRYGQLIRYQTKYTVDRNDPKRIIIGLHIVGTVDETQDESY